MLQATAGVVGDPQLDFGNTTGDSSILARKHPAIHSYALQVYESLAPDIPNFTPPMLHKVAAAAAQLHLLPPSTQPHQVDSTFSPTTESSSSSATTTTPL